MGAIVRHGTDLSHVGNGYRGIPGHSCVNAAAFEQVDEAPGT
jgi:hypothetical protein